MKSPFNDVGFITRRYLWNEQALSADEIYNDAVHTQPQETKHKDDISRSTSNNSSQAQEFYLPDVLIRVRVENDHSSKQVELFIVELGVQNSQFRQWF